MVPGLTPVPYMDETGANATATEYTQIEPTTANWTGGLYVVKGNVTTPGMRPFPGPCRASSSATGRA